MKYLKLILIGSIYSSLSFAQNPIIIDHTCNELKSIPVEWVNQAKENLFIGYGHTSHGSQLASGMNAVEQYFTDGTYNWSHDGGTDELHLFEGSGYSTGYLELDVGYSGWDDETREYLTAFPECNVIIWSWCGQVNDVNLQTHYFEPMEQLESEYPNVKFVYMTGHLEGLGPDGSLFHANQQIRDFCSTNNKILFDFTDIEKYDPDGMVNYQEYYVNDGCNYDPDGVEPIERTANWAINWINDNPSHELTQIAGKCSSCAHSECLNCTKKGIAAWYLWARLAGWDGNTGFVPVNDITITGEGGVSSINIQGGTLQLYAEVLPVNATNPDIEWSVQNETGQASINSAGLVTALADGTVTVTAAATDGSGVTDNFEITISNQSIPVNNISITSEAGATTINVQGGTLQLYAEVMPVNATNPDIEWSVQKGTGQATINSAGLVTALADGTVTVTAAATDGSGVTDNFEITISNQSIPVNNITITSEAGATTINVLGGTLQLYAEVLPVNASNPDIEWSLQNGTGQATINSAGLVTALADGTVTVTAAATDGSEVRDNLIITITNQNVLVDQINISSENGLTLMNEIGGTLQLIAEVLPSNATNPDIIWSIENGTGEATINSDGRVTAVDFGTITAVASATDGSGIFSNFQIVIAEQVVPVTDINIRSSGGITNISDPGGKLQLTAEILPADATNPLVHWTIKNNTGEATVNNSGLVSAIADGKVTVTASATDGSGIVDSLSISIENQTPIPVIEIILTSEENKDFISEPSGSIQLQAEIVPTDATDKRIHWSINNVTGTASIDTNGLVKAIHDGTVYAKATSIENAKIFDFLIINISNQAPDNLATNETGQEVRYYVSGKILYFNTIPDNINYIRIADLYGRIVAVQKPVDGMNRIDLQKLSGGLYAVQFIFKDEDLFNELLIIP